MKTTPKEKAYELISKFVGISLSQVNDLVDGIRIRLAKESALIAVEEILNNNCGSHTDGLNAATNSEIYCDEYFWNDVKSELQSF
jgi:hypothetical protein